MALSRKRKIIIGSVAAVVLALIVGISIFASRSDEPEVTTVKLETRPELRSTVTASGEVRPVKFINLTSEVAGRIEEIYVNPGDHVKVGQPLVRLDPTQLQSSQEAQLAGVQAAISDVANARTQITAAQNQVGQAQQSLNQAETGVAVARQQVNTAETNIVTAQTSVDRAKVDLNAAQRELKRLRDLAESGAVSRQELDAATDRFEQAQVTVRTAQAQYDTARAQLRQQQIAVQEALVRVNQARLTVRDAQTSVQRANVGVTTSEARANAEQARLTGSRSQLSKATQVSTLAGVVADIPSRVGQFAVAGLSTTPLLTIADMSTVNVEVNVDETAIASVEVGQPAKIKVDALGERELQGTVTQKNPLAVSKSDTTGGGIRDRVNVQEAKEFKVVVEITNIADELRDQLRPGMTATADITTKVKQNVVAVPLQAIVEKSDKQTSGGAASPTPTPAGIAKEKPKKGVYVLENNRVKFVEVETGITGETDIETTSGLGAGTEVITGPSRVLRTLKDGTKVKRQTKPPGGTNSNSNGGA